MAGNFSGRFETVERKKKGVAPSAMKGYPGNGERLSGQCRRERKERMRPVSVSQFATVPFWKQPSAVNGQRSTVNGQRARSNRDA